MTYQPYIIVSDERNIHVTYFLLPGQTYLRILGHCYDFPAQLRIPFALGSGTEPGALNSNSGTRRIEIYIKFAGTLNNGFSQNGTIRIGHRYVYGFRSIVKSVYSPLCSIHKLVTHHKLSRLYIWLQTSGTGGNENTFYTYLFHCINIRPVVYFMRW